MTQNHEEAAAPPSVETSAIPAERQRFLLERIESEGRISSAQAASEFGVSEDTIRRDLRDLADAGLVQRVHGGALRKTRITHRFDGRLIQREEQKIRLAARARSFIAPGMVVLLDQSTSNLKLAQQLPEKADITIVTPAPDIALAALSQGIDRVILIGGRLDPCSRGATGAAALEQIAQIAADMVFLGACAVDPTRGLAAMDHDDACVKRAMIASPTRVIALITADKLGTQAPFRVAPLSRLDHLITERDVPPQILQSYADSGVEIHLA